MYKFLALENWYLLLAMEIDFVVQFDKKDIPQLENMLSRNLSVGVVCYLAEPSHCTILEFRSTIPIIFFPFF